MSTLRRPESDNSSVHKILEKKRHRALPAAHASRARPITRSYGFAPPYRTVHKTQQTLDRFSKPECSAEKTVTAVLEMGVLESSVQELSFSGMHHLTPVASSASWRIRAL